MTLSLRQKLTIVPLLLYWPAVFIATHIPRVPAWVSRLGTSDKTLHFFAYLILVFLLWFATSPGKKVNWRRAAVWWVLLAMVWYGAVDEWLQGYVGRSPDIRDFLADMAGVLSSLILLTVFPAWPVSLALTAAAIVISTNVIRTNPAEPLPVVNAVFGLFGYGLFTLLWVRYIPHFLPLRPPQIRWLTGAFVLPAALLAAAELFSGVAGNDFRFSSIIISAAAITAVIAASYLPALCRQKPPTAGD
jgi:VanZ family protein